MPDIAWNWYLLILFSLFLILLLSQIFYDFFVDKLLTPKDKKDKKDKDNKKDINNKKEE